MLEPERADDGRDVLVVALGQLVDGEILASCDERNADRGDDLARRERPKLIFCGGTAIPRTIDFPAFAEIARDDPQSWKQQLAGADELLPARQHLAAQQGAVGGRLDDGPRQD